MGETLDVVIGRRKAKTRGDTRVAPCAYTAERCSSRSVVPLTGQPRVFQLPGWAMRARHVTV